MATKKCMNGHQYDSGIYGDNCPFCPSGNTTKVIEDDMPGAKTQVIGGAGFETPTETVNIGGSPHHNQVGGATVIRHSASTGATGIPSGNRRLVGLLVSYDQNPMGEVYKVYEGRNVIGRGATSDIPIMTDSNISSQHLLILYREAEDIFWAADQNSSNGTYINGKFVSDRVQLTTNDIIVVGATKMVFLAIPQ